MLSFRCFRNFILVLLCFFIIFPSYAKDKFLDKLSYRAELLFLQPTSGNLIYAVEGYGLQPNSPGWNNLVVPTSFSPAFEFEIDY